ncbi:MAG: hypothetical protein R3B91_02560 [Planctomycetaceae bacterium]
MADCVADAKSAFRWVGGMRVSWESIRTGSSRQAAQPGTSGGSRRCH